MAANRNNNNSIRFRRWSRKGYAVFASLSKAVTIGVVQFSIEKQALKKTKHTYLESNQRDSVSDSPNYSEEQLTDNSEFVNQEILKNKSLIVSISKVEACEQYLNINIYKQKLISE